MKGNRGISLMVLLTLSVIAIALTPATASAQTAKLMYVDGIKGSSTESKHVGWINLASLGQTASNPVQQATGVQGRPIGACDVEVLKGLDAARPALWLAMLQGRAIADVRIEVWMTRPAGDQVEVYEVRLKGVRITRITAASALTFAETVAMSGDSIELTALTYSATGTPAGSTRTGFNCKTGAYF
jgi:type VI secretion system Hcp family effector